MLSSPLGSLVVMCLCAVRRTVVASPPTISETIRCWLSLVRDLFADLAAATQDCGPVGDLHDVVHGVRHDHHGMALVAQASDQVQDLVGFAHAERGGGLVEDDDVGRERRRPRHSDGLTLTA